MEYNNHYKVGYISKTHGLKGEVTIIFTNPIDVESGASLFLELRGSLVPYFIESFSARPDKTFVKFEDVNTAEQANTLKGASLYQLKSARPKLKRGEFYPDEILGFQVKDENLGPLGWVLHVEEGTNPLIAINFNGNEVLIPIQGPFILSVNKSKKIISVLLPDGFTDI